MKDPLDTPVTIIPRERFGTVHALGIPASSCVDRACTVHTSDWRAPPGSSANLHKVTAEPLGTLRAVLTRHFTTEALCMGYVVTRQGRPFDPAPRVAKDALPWLRAEGLDVVTTCFIADVDTPRHVPWTDAFREDFERLWETAPSLRTCGMYFSAKGYRLLQPLTEWLPVDLAEPRFHAWLRQLTAEGVWSTVLECKDWTHLMRVAHHRKGGTRRTSERVSFERMVAIDPPPPLLGSLPNPRRRSARPTQGGVVALPVFAADCPSDWTDLADQLGVAIRDTVTANWRRCYLALAGALLERGCDPSVLPAVIARAHRVDPAWEHLTPGRVEIARTTAVRWCAGQDLLASRVLREEFSGVAAILDRSPVAEVEARAEARVRRQLAAPFAPYIAQEEASRQLAEEIEHPHEGVTLIEGPPGLGKTQAILNRAVHLPVITDRAAPGSRMALATPHHDLARQIRGDLPERTRRLFGPLAHRQPDGRYTCIHREAAQGLADGGQSVEWEFCQGRNKAPCEHASSCEARDGTEGPSHANLVVGPHEKLGELGGSGAAGERGLLVIDEPEGVVATEVVTLDQFDTARRFLDAFVPRYARAIAPALAALDAWTRTIGPEDEALHALPDALRGALNAVSAEILAAAEIDPEAPAEELGTAILKSAQGAILSDAKSKAPPIQWLQMAVARRSPGRAAELGAASRVLDLLWRGVVSKPPFAVRVETRRGARVLLITGLDVRVVSALRRSGPVVLLGADVGLHREAVARVVGYEPRFVPLRVADGAPVARTIYATTNATRRRWCPRGAPDWSGGFLQSLRVALAWAAEDPTTRVLAIMTWAVFAAAIGHALAPDAREPRELWKVCGQSAGSIEEARQLLAPILGTWRGEILVGHYHHLRGLNYMRDADAGVTLGDPRPNVGQIEDQALYLGLDPFARADLLAAAEIEQAHGRLRTIHRTRPARLCHIGEIVNPSWVGHPVDVRTFQGGRPRTVAAMAPTELRAIRTATGMSLRVFAEKLGVSKSSVERWEGARPETRGSVIPAEVAVRARSFALTVPQTPSLNIELNRGLRDSDPLHGFAGQTLTGVCGTSPRRQK